MPNWNESEYVSRANEVARQFVTEKKPLNDLCEKVARDEALNPDEIRTLVRLSNVAAFQQVFKERNTAGAPDRMVEFDVGNPESVIQRIQSSVDDPPQTANIHNDKLAHECPDMMKEIRLGRKFDEQVKVAHEDVPERPMKRDMALILGRKLAAEFEVERLMAGNKWAATMQKIAVEFKKAHGYGRDFADFVKAAFAEYGEAARPELGALVDELRLKLLLHGPEKVAELQGRFIHDETPELKLLGEALEARQIYVKFAKAKSTLETALKG